MTQQTSQTETDRKENLKYVRDMRDTAKSKHTFIWSIRGRDKNGSQTTAEEIMTKNFQNW